ncbi:MAG: 2-oxo acid dehydrogenase subunit E2, partial [Pseudomonadota bacterium]
GLITPIIRDADHKSLREIAAEIKELSGRARAGKLMPEEYQGGTVSVSNLGMFGIDSFDAIINPPQSCIFAIGAGKQKPTILDGAIKVGTFVDVTLSVDHRVIDGVLGAQVLNVFKRALENPLDLLI